MKFIVNNNKILIWVIIILIVGLTVIKSLIYSVIIKELLISLVVFLIVALFVYSGLFLMNKLHNIQKNLFKCPVKYSWFLGVSILLFFVGTVFEGVFQIINMEDNSEISGLYLYAGGLIASLLYTKNYFDKHII